MAWRLRSQLRCNGGPGLPKEYFRKPKPPSARLVDLGLIEAQLSKMQLPKHYAVSLLRQYRPRSRALKQILQRITSLREQLKEAEVRLAGIRRQIREALTGKVETVTEPASAPAPRVDDDQDSQDDDQG